MEIIISALISAVSAILVSVIGTFAQYRKSMNKLTEIDALQTYRIDQLEKQADKHEQTANRVILLEKDQEATEEKMKTADQRIAELEHRFGRQIL